MCDKTKKDDNLEYPKGELALEQVSSLEFEPKFKAGRQDILNFGLTDSAYRPRIRIHNEAPPPLCGGWN